MMRLHVHVSVENLAAATDFYTAMFGIAPAQVEASCATWSLDAPRLDLTIAVDGREPGLDRLGFETETDDDLVAIHRRLGAANLAAASNGADRGGNRGPAKANANRAVDPMGLVWEGHRVRPVVGQHGRFHVVEGSAAASTAGGVRPFADDVASSAAQRRLNVLFLCTGNSARSIMAEAIMNRLGMGRFRAFSAGSAPRGEVNPAALALLERMNHPTAGLRSKSWEEFSGPDGPKLDFVFTLCDNAASEICPIWPGQPMSAHWGLPDPAAATGNDAERGLAFADTYRMLEHRISIFINLPIPSLDRLSLQRRLDRIGRATGA